MLISFVFIVTVQGMKMKCEREEIIFDLLTVTINDYTVEIELSEKQIYHFIRDYYNNDV